jgi:hypothetical protein
MFVTEPGLKWGLITIGKRRGHIIDRLARLTKQELASEHYTSFEKETRSETNHRGAAILIAVNLELERFPS